MKYAVIPAGRWLFQKEISRTTAARLPAPSRTGGIPGQDEAVGLKRDMVLFAGASDRQT